MAGEGARLRRGAEETKEGMSPGQLLLVLGVVLLVLNLLVGLVAWVTFQVLRRARRVRAWWITGLGVLVVAGTLLWLEMGPGYVQGWVEVVDVVLAQLAQGPAVWVPAVLDLAAARWPAWLAAQAPIAAGAGLIIGGLAASYARRHTPSWRKESEARAPLTRDAAVKRAAKMPTWAEAPRTVTRQSAPTARTARAARPQRPVTVEDVKIRVGVDVDTRRPADFPLSALLQHCWIDGASGFGKTTDIITLVRGVLESPAAGPLNCPVVYVTMKPDPAVTEALRRSAHHAGREFRHVSITGSTHYNPLRRGTAAAIATRVVEVEEAAADGGFSEPHYKANGMELLAYAARTLDELIAAGRTYERGGKRHPWTRDLWHLHRLMRVSTLLSVRHHLSADLRLDLDEFAEELEENKKKAEACEGMRARIGRWNTSGAGRLLREDPEAVDLDESLQRGDVIVMDLDSMQDAVAARTLANLAVKDLEATISELGAIPWHKKGDDVVRMALAIVDEFSALGGEAVVNLLQRGRGNGAAVVLATQDVGSVVEHSEGLLTTILTNTNVQLVHVQSERAEDYAGAWGTDPALKETMQIFEDRTVLGPLTRRSGQGSLREVDQYVVHPNKLRKLGPGEIILATRYPWSQRHVLVKRSTPPPIETAAEAAPAPEQPAPPAEDDAQPAPEPAAPAADDRSPEDPQPAATDPAEDEAWGDDPFDDFTDDDDQEDQR